MTDEEEVARAKTEAMDLWNAAYDACVDCVGDPDKNAALVIEQALTRLRREAREAMREDAAKVAEAAIANEGFGDPWDSGWDAACEENASAIRALSTDAQGEGVK